MIYHKPVSDRLRNFLTLPVGRNDLSNSVVLYYAVLQLSQLSHLVTVIAISQTARVTALCLSHWSFHLLQISQSLATAVTKLSCSICDSYISKPLSQLYFTETLTVLSSSSCHMQLLLTAAVTAISCSSCHSYILQQLSQLYLAAAVISISWPVAVTSISCSSWHSLSCSSCQSYILQQLSQVYLAAAVTAITCSSCHIYILASSCHSYILQ